MRHRPVRQTVRLPWTASAFISSGLTGLVLLMLSATPAWAAIDTLIASYEPSETDLTVTAGDTGLTVTRVLGGSGGIPSATDGQYVLKVQFSGEDGKVEFRHDWSASTYDLAGNDVLLADVYIATSSALPGLMGIWSSNWNPPDAWQIATGIPTAVGTWTTVSFDLGDRTQTDLNQIWAFVFEDMPGASGTAYVDNLRLRRNDATPTPASLAANAFADRNELVWPPVKDTTLQGYNLYRSVVETGPFTKLNPQLLAGCFYSDPVGADAPEYFYRVTAVAGGLETSPSNVVAAVYNGLTDDQLLDLEQEAAFRYFWDYAHPVSGMAREGLTHWNEICATGGTGMGLMAIVVGADRGFVTRSAAAVRVQKILTFLETSATRYHGAWAHWINGTTGQTIPFSTYDDGGDLVETAYLTQGLLTVRQYFAGSDATEVDVRARATRLWEGVDWNWYRRYDDSQVMYWHWSPNYAWTMNMPIRGYNEAMIVYLLAVASPTHPVPPSTYANGWEGDPGYANGNTYYGFVQWVGPPLGGPLFFTHYTFLGFDPRYKRDAYCNYYDNHRNISLIHRAYSSANPNNFGGYNRWAWGLTASASTAEGGYWAHCPTSDNGTIAPTAALSAMPYTPAESLATLRYFADTYGASLWGTYGFLDAFNPGLNWYSDTYLAIDQGPIVVMIENYRSGLCWRLFMSNPEIPAMVRAIGFRYEVDFDQDGYIQFDDFVSFASCLNGPGNVPGCSGSDADLDDDTDVDLGDFSVFQGLFTGP